VNCGDELVGLSRDDREGLEAGTVGPLPRVPDTCEGEGSGFGECNGENRLIGLTAFVFFAGVGAPMRSPVPAGASSATSPGSGM
jgi:hypothetical protein